MELTVRVCVTCNPTPEDNPLPTPNPRSKLVLLFNANMWWKGVNKLNAGEGDAAVVTGHAGDEDCCWWVSSESIRSNNEVVAENRSDDGSEEPGCWG